MKRSKGSRSLMLRLAAGSVQQHGLDHGGQISPHALAIVGKHRSHAAHMGGIRVAAHQLLDELARDEGAHIGMGADDVQRAAQVLPGGLAARDAHAQHRLGASVVPGLVRHHGAGGVGRGGGRGVVGRDVVVEIPTGQGPGQFADVGVGVGFVATLGIDGGLARCIQRHQADGEELKQLAGVVFVGSAAGGGVGLAAAAQAEVGTHGGRQGDGLDQIAESAPAVGFQRVPVGHAGEMAPGDGHVAL